MSNNQPSSKAKPKMPVKLIVVQIVFIVIILASYFFAASYYNTHFLGNTYINDIDFSNCTVSEALRKLNLNENSQTFKIIGKDGNVETVKCKDFEYKTSAKEELETILGEQSNYSWFKSISLFGGKENSYYLDLEISYDEKALESVISELGCVTNGTQESQNATIEYGENGYFIQEETIGNIVEVNKLTDAVKKCLKNGEMQLYLEDNNCYKLPSVTKDNPNLQTSLSKIKLLENVTITYDFKDRTEVLDKNKIKGWIKLDNNGEITLNHEAVSLFVSQLAYKYDTYLTDREFTTTDGRKITVGGGIYGWQIDKEKETEALENLILSGTSETRQPIYYIEGFERAENDIGNTYIEVDLSTQHLWYYKNGELFLETDVVTGYPYNGHSTPTGVFCIWSREKDRFLVGETYNTHVDFWMPINWDGVGLHDAWWQTAFGGEVYKTANGSHGCINLPFNIAESIYNNASVGTPVVVY